MSAPLKPLLLLLLAEDVPDCTAGLIIGDFTAPDRLQTVFDHKAPAAEREIVHGQLTEMQIDGRPCGHFIDHAGFGRCCAVRIAADPAASAKQHCRCQQYGQDSSFHRISSPSG